MAKYRRQRINDAVMQTINETVREIKDPRVNEAMVTVTAAEVSADLKFAKVYFSAMLGDNAEVKRGLDSASGFLRRQIAQKLNLRITPQLSFFEDKSVEHGAKIAKILNDIEISEPDDEDVL